MFLFLFGVILGHSHQISLLNILRIPDFGVDSQSGRWDDGRQGHPSIASELLQTLSYVSIYGATYFLGDITSHNGIYGVTTTKNHL